MAVPSPPPVVRPAALGERAAALRLLFRRTPEPEREGRVAAGLFLLQQGEADPDGLLIVPGPDSPRAAALFVPLPGAAAQVWPPQSLDGMSAEDALMWHGVGWLRARGARLAQSMLVPDEAAEAACLTRNGFAFVTHLRTMRRPCARPLPPPRGHARLRYAAYGPEEASRFRAVLGRTYEDTLDCPEINGVRTVEEVVAGHLAQGIHDPDRWWLALADTGPVGLILMTPVPDLRAWEVAYMGVVPGERGRGYGAEMLRMALGAAEAARVEAVTLAVDERNLPARRLYSGAGFDVVERRAVHLAVWRT